MLVDTVLCSVLLKIVILLLIIIFLEVAGNTFLDVVIVILDIELIFFLIKGLDNVIKPNMNVLSIPSIYSIKINCVVSIL